MTSNRVETSAAKKQTSKPPDQKSGATIQDSPGLKQQISAILQLLAAVITIVSAVIWIGSLRQAHVVPHTNDVPTSSAASLPVEGPATKHDRIGVTFGKLLVVVLVLVAAVLATIPALLLDAIMAPFGYDMPNLRRVWDRAWDGVFLDWFWRPLNPALLYFCLALAAACLVIYIRSENTL